MSQLARLRGGGGTNGANGTIAPSSRLKRVPPVQKGAPDKMKKKS